MSLKISVVVPSYNQGHYLDETLQSVISQNYPNLELIVMDGGSNDNSVDVIERHSANIAYWVSKRDGGQTHALVDGFRRSTGDIQCWINSDDLMKAGCLFEVEEFFLNNPSAQFVFGDTTWIDKDGRILREQREIGFNLFIWMYTYNYIPGMSAYWRRDLYESVGGLDPSFNLAMDADLWSRFAQVAKLYHVRRSWSCMRYYPEQKNVALRSQSELEDLRIRQRYWGPNRPRFQILRKGLASVLRIFARVIMGCYQFIYRRYLSRSID
jgi:glycosyltransferase involved in cell wall biosynthesis